VEQVGRHIAREALAKRFKDRYLLLLGRPWQKNDAERDRLLQAAPNALPGGNNGNHDQRLLYGERDGALE
jgi:hypothetical protein